MQSPLTITPCSPIAIQVLAASWHRESIIAAGKITNKRGVRFQRSIAIMCIVETSLEANCNTFGLLCKHKEKVVAYSIFSFEGSDALKIDILCAHPDRYSSPNPTKGAGTKLLHTICSIATYSGREKVKLIPSAAAKSFYIENGFEQDGLYLEKTITTLAPYPYTLTPVYQPKNFEPHFVLNNQAKFIYSYFCKTFKKASKPCPALDLNFTTQALENRSYQYFACKDKTNYVALFRIDISSFTKMRLDYLIDISPECIATRNIYNTLRLYSCWTNRTLIMG